MPASSPQGMTLDYYERNAESFFNATIDVDMRPLYRRFLALLPPKARILDAGCGAGRDLRAFSELGHRVTAFDASPALAALAAEYAGQPVACARFDEIDWREAFEGVWACASLLHVSGTELPDALRRLACALVPGGVLYVSFKYGRGEREHQGRQFTDLDEDALRALLDQVRDLRCIEVWVTGDQRPGRESERWLNGLLRRCP